MKTSAKKKEHFTVKQWKRAFATYERACDRISAMAKKNGDGFCFGVTFEEGAVAKAPKRKRK